MSDILQIETIGEIHRVTMNRPDRLNAVNHPMAEELLAYFEARRRDTDTRVIVLRGAGRAFTSGADLKAFGQPDMLRDGPNGDWVLRDTMNAMRNCPQPIIATVHGAAAGAGLALALASDVLVVGESAKFHSAFLKIGLSGTELGVSWRLQRAVGMPRAREILLTGRPVDAQEALRIGLASQLVPDASLDELGLSLAKAMLEAKPDALRVTKRALDAALEIGNFGTALETEERGQMLMINRRRS